jgi:hypothetical protein
MKTWIRIAALTAGSVALGAPVTAHHSFAMFDAQKQQTLTGVVREFQWTNPHTWIQLLVDDGKGGSVEWAVEGNSPNILVRQGYTSKIIKPGDKVTLLIRPLKDGSKGGSLVSITLADGRVLGSNAGAASGKP